MAGQTVELKMQVAEAVRQMCALAELQNQTELLQQAAAAAADAVVVKVHQVHQEMVEMVEMVAAEKDSTAVIHQHPVVQLEVVKEETLEQFKVHLALLELDVLGS